MNLLRKVWRLIPRDKRHTIARSVSNSWLYRKTLSHRALLGQRPHRLDILKIEITDRCNLRCNYCPRSLGIDGKNGDMDFETFKKMVDYCASRGVTKYALIGVGEPTLYPKLIESIAYIKETAPNATIGFNTNGIRLSYELGHNLAAAGLSRITISINATSREQYKRLNGADLFDKVVKNTQDFLRAINESGRKSAFC
ncbi:MAG: radical SAM protein [Helicobacteraceae bacterium]|jgi:molybdenum cofactor biosynthesis enzyme MoaA|nr:radical SAM protein [Helicobacteraceae bacterium]